MRTLKECLRNRPIPVLLLNRYKSKNNVNYYLCKTRENDIHYFMEEENVIKQGSFKDNLESLYINYLNDKTNQENIDLMKKQSSYKAFKKFVKEQCGEEI